MPSTATLTRNGSEQAVILLNEDGSIVDAQPSCAAALGWSPDELKGRDIGMLLRTGRDLILEQVRLCQCPEADLNGNSSFSVRALARRKNHTQFSARVTVRKFPQLGCWTVVFYTHVSDLESDTPPSVSPEEIELATRALQEQSALPRDEAGMASAHDKPAMTAENALWRTARLLVRSRKHLETVQETEPREELTPEPAELAEQPVHAVAEEIAQPNSEEASPEAGEALAEPLTSPVEEEVQPVAIQEEISPTPEETPVVETTPAATEPAPPVERLERTETVRETTENMAAVARLRGELERERGQRTRAEQRAASLNTQVQALHLQLNENLAAESANSARITELETQLELSQQLLGQTRADLEKESMERGAAEEQLQTTRDLNAQLEANLAAFEASLAALEQEKQELAVQVQAGRDALRESELSREVEIKSRQEMELRAAAAVREQQECEAKSKSDLMANESALRASELRCKRLEADLLRSRSDAIDQERQASRHAAAFRDSLQAPVQNLSQTACQLLQSGLADEQKQLMELLLNDVLAVESALRERMHGAEEYQDTEKAA